MTVSSDSNIREPSEVIIRELLFVVISLICDLSGEKSKAGATGSRAPVPNGHDRAPYLENF